MMKIFIISVVLCLIGSVHNANIQRMTRNTEAIIPSIVQEILKVELQSDLKKNNLVEVTEAEVKVKDETKADEGVMKVEVPTDVVEKKVPEMKETIAEEKPKVEEIEIVKEIVEEKVKEVPVMSDEVKSEIVSIVKEEIVDQKPELIKETITVMEQGSDLRQETPAEIVITKEEIVVPSVKNVVKEEIPQVEELRKTIIEEKSTVKEDSVAPVASPTDVKPAVVEIDMEIKTVPVEQPKQEQEVKAVPETIVMKEVIEEVQKPLEQVQDEVKAEKPIVEEELKLKKEDEMKKEEEKADVKPEEATVMATEKPVVIEMEKEMVVSETKVSPVSDAEKSITEKKEDGETRQDRPTIIQQVQEVLSNVPVVGQILNRNPPAASDEPAIADESETTPRPGFIQQALQNIQNTLNGINPLNPLTNNNGAGETTPRPPGPLAQVLSATQTAAQNTIENFGQAIQNFVNPTTKTTSTTPKSEDGDEEREEVMENADEKVEVVEESEVPAVAAEVAEAAEKKEEVELKKEDNDEDQNLVKN